MGIELVETERLRLERWRVAAHTDALVEMNTDPEIMRYVGGAPASREASAEQSERFAGHWERFGFGLWAMRDRASGDFLGFAGLSHPLWFPAEIEHVEVGWRLKRAAWGHGYATEAGHAGLEAAFGPLGLAEVVSYIDPDNARSQAVATRLGLRRARVARHPSRGDDIEVWSVRPIPAPRGKPVLPDRAPAGGVVRCAVPGDGPARRRPGRAG